MSRTDFSIPSLGNQLVDLRESLPGDAYNWSWERSLSQVNYLAIHHTGTQDTSTPQEIASQHISSNGWGGIGYHFLISAEGAVFYVGDISTARANVATLNEQVIGIGLIGDFTEGRVPTIEQIDSTHKLCEFFIHYQPLENVASWDKVRGHKELPGQSTPCPGDNWEVWRIQIVEGLPEKKSFVFNPTILPNPDLQSQVDSLQASLASVNQQVISLQENLQEKDQEISRLRVLASQTVPLIQRPKDIPASRGEPKTDDTLTIVGAFINLYKFVFPPRKES